MRNCIRCNTAMEEGYGLKIENLLAGTGPVYLSKGNKLYSDRLVKMKVAVCLQCGYSELYLDAESLEKIKG